MVKRAAFYKVGKFLNTPEVLGPHGTGPGLGTILKSMNGIIIGIVVVEWQDSMPILGGAQKKHPENAQNMSICVRNDKMTLERYGWGANLDGQRGGKHSILLLITAHMIYHPNGFPAQAGAQGPTHLKTSKMEGICVFVHTEHEIVWMAR